MKESSGNYYVYILTNKIKTTLYTGITNNLERRIIEHYNGKGNPKTFTGLYNCYWLIYYETFASAKEAIAREKEIKGWRRSKKEQQIAKFNPAWRFLNMDLFGKWPPEGVE